MAKTNLISKIVALMSGAEYIESASVELNRLFVKACKASDYFDVVEVENLLNKVIEINGLEA